MSNLLQVLIDAMSLGSLYALSALGVGLLFGIMRLINFAHGDFIMLGAYALIVPSANVIATLYVGAWPWPVMIVSIVVFVVLIALATERIVFKPIRQASSETLLIASFALSFFLEYLVLLIYGGRPKAINIGTWLNHQMEFGGLRVQNLDIVTFAVTVTLIGGLALFLRKTRYGIEMRAASEDFRMARLLGVRANAVIAIAFAISGLLAAAVSLLFIARTGILFPRMGIQLVMLAFVSTVIGGMGSLVGAAAGGFFVGITSVLMQSVLPMELRESRDAFVFGLVILILLVRPQGLIAAKMSKERV